MITWAKEMHVHLENGSLPSRLYSSLLCCHITLSSLLDVRLGSRRIGCGVFLRSVISTRPAPSLQADSVEVHRRCLVVWKMMNEVPGLQGK